MYLAVISAYDPGLPGLRTLYFSSGRGFTSAPTDTPANTFFDPRLIQPVTIARHIYSAGATHGGTKLALGDLVLNNADGGLDGILDYGFDGRDLTVYEGADDSAFPGAFSAIFAGTMESAEWDHRRITIRVRDRQFDTTRVLQTAYYAGTGGAEGGADVNGKPKPATFGVVLNAPGVLVDPAANLWQWHTGAVTFGAVYDKGKALTLGTAHGSLAALQGATVSAGTYHTWAAGGMARTAAPAGTVTADVTEGAAAADRRVGALVRRVLEFAGVPTAQIDTTALAELDTVRTMERGVFIGENRATATVLDEIVAPDAWWGQNGSGLFTAALFDAPSGTPAAVFTTADLIRFERVTETGGSLPVWLVRLGYQRNHTVQAGDALDAAVTSARRSFLDQEYRTKSSQDGAVRTVHANAASRTIPTAWAGAAATETEAARLLAIWKVRRDIYDVRVKLSTAEARLVQLGGVVRVVHNRFGLAAGKLFRVIGHETDARRGFLNLTLWG